MLNWLRKIFAVPEFPSEEASRMARQLNTIYIVSIVFFLGCDLLLAVVGYPLASLPYWIFLGLALIIAILLVVMRHGYLRQTAALFIAICFVGLVINAGTQTGIYDSTFLGMTAVILLAGVLLGPWGLLTFTVLSILAGFTLAYVARAGLISHPIDTPINTAIYLAGIFIINAIFAYLAISNLNASIKRGQVTESKLLASNNELVALRAGLEKQVEERTAELAYANEQSQRRAGKFEAVAEVARVTTVRRDPAQLLSEMTNLISEHFGYYHVGIFLLEEGGKYAALHAANSLGGQQMLAKKFHVDLADGSLVSLAISGGKTQVALSAEFNYPDLPATHSEAILLLKVGERVTGALDIQSEAPDAFTTEDIEILNILADQAAIIIEDARLFSETAQALSESRSSYGQYLRQAWNKLPQEINLTGFQYMDGKTNPIESPIDLPEIQSAFQSGKAVSNTAKSNVLAIPLKLRDQVIGVLDIRSNASANFSESQLSLIRAIAERVSLALENARLFEETTRRADRERRVSEISNHIRSVSDPETMLQTALEELKHALGANDIQIRPYTHSPTDKIAGKQIDPLENKTIHPSEAA
jgi:GAF domain-containing protein